MLTIKAVVTVLNGQVVFPGVETTTEHSLPHNENEDDRMSRNTNILERMFILILSFKK